MRVETEPVTSAPIRWLLAAGGVLCVALGTLGIVLPGLPTTPFLLAASYLFVRSSPRLHRWLLTRPWLRPYLEAMRGERAVGWRTRAALCGVLWISLASTLYLLHRADSGGMPVVLSVTGLGLVVTTLIWRWKRD